MPNTIDPKYNQSAFFNTQNDRLIRFKYYMDPTKIISKQLQREFDVTLIKLYPTDNLKLEQRTLKTTGTGFAITQDGYIVTNNHVVKGATSISIYGANGDFDNSYDADIIGSSEESDLALLKIRNSYFKFKKSIPFVLDYIDKPVGTGTYTLGYPMTKLMGDEIKITDGIKSSNTGFQGDKNSFQISIPIQPGNSGSPLLTKQGELIGIINAKLTVGENVSYAIKTHCLKELLLAINEKSIILNKVNLLKGKSLIDQIKLCKDFVFIIECKK